MSASGLAFSRCQRAVKERCKKAAISLWRSAILQLRRSWSWLEIRYG